MTQIIYLIRVNVVFVFGGEQLGERDVEHEGEDGDGGRVVHQLPYDLHWRQANDGQHGRGHPRVHVTKSIAN